MLDFLRKRTGTQLIGHDLTSALKRTAMNDYRNLALGGIATWQLAHRLAEEHKECDQQGENTERFCDGKAKDQSTELTVSR